MGRKKKVKQPREKVERQLPECINQFLKYGMIRNLSKNTLLAYERDLYAFCEWLKQYKSIDEITADTFDKLTLSDTNEWRLTLANEKSTEARKISSLKAILRYLKDDTKEITSDLAERIPMPKLPEKIAFKLNKETTTKFIDKVYEVGTIQEQAIVMLLFNTGMRASEVCKLNLDDIKGDEIYIRGAKGDKDRINVANKEVLEAINAWLKVRPKTSDKALFLIDQFTSKEPYRITYTSVRNMIVKYKNMLKIEDMHPHATRHTTATLMLDEGVPIETIQHMLGHKYRSTTEKIYAKYTTQQQRNVVNRVSFSRSGK